MVVNSTNVLDGCVVRYGLCEFLQNFFLGSERACLAVCEHEEFVNGGKGRGPMGNDDGDTTAFAD